MDEEMEVLCGIFVKEERNKVKYESMHAPKSVLFIF